VNGDFDRHAHHDLSSFWPLRLSHTAEARKEVGIKTTFRWLLIAALEGSGLSSCHSATKRGSAATDLQMQNAVRLSQEGQTTLPPNCVRA
jgi:hypothetical protein